MRILHLSTSQIGGAGKSAAILNEHLQASGVSSQILTRPTPGFQKMIKGKGSTLLGKLSSTLEYDFLSSHSVSTLDFKALHEIQPQIIHIHNWYNLISVEDFSKLAQIAPLVFTLHDERLATGGCHVTLGCKKFLERCEYCPAHRLKLSREKYRKDLENFYESGQQYSVISPSLWMMDQLKNSALLLNAYSTAVIPNHLSSANQTISPYQPNSDSIKLIFASSNLDVPYKGLQILLSAMRILDSRLEGLDKKINLTIVGDASLEKLKNLKNITTARKNHLNNDVLMNLVRESDILIVPSLSENYPGVIAEGQAQGARVVAHRVGGIPEMITDGLTGYLCDPDASSLAAKILEAILDPNAERVRANAFEEVLIRQDSNKINASHIDFYTRLLERKSA
jgi:glycosyltransferase involved in cell wall biosynthesis